MKKKLMKKKKQLNELGIKSLERSLEEKDFLKEGYYKSLGILFFSLFSLLMSFGYIFYAHFVYTPPVSYLVLNENNQVLEEEPLNTFHVDQNTVEQWTTDAFLDIFNYNYLNFDKHGVVVSKYFYEPEMPKFMEEFNGLLTQKILKAGKGISTVDVLKAFEFQQSGEYGVRQAAILEGVFLLKLHLDDGIKTVRYKAEALVVREKFSVQKDGLSLAALKIVEG